MTSPFDDLGGTPAGVSIPSNYSYKNIIQTASLSGLLGPDPLLRDTNDLDSFDQGYSYHFTGNAVDFGDDRSSGSPQQQSFALWVMQHYLPYTLELIHLDADGTYFAVKYGKVVSYDFYGDETMKGHLNHVHWAITNTGLALGAKDPFQMLATINTNGPLKMDAPIIRTAQGLLEARGGMIKPDNTNHPVFGTNTKWFQGQAGLVVDGIIGEATWVRLTQPLNGK